MSLQKEQQVKDFEAQIVPSKISNLVLIITKGKLFFIAVNQKWTKQISTD